jgi:para-nitrobenzyl esterase
VYAWTDADEQLSELMQQYYANFIRNGDPNGPGVPRWPEANVGETVQLIRLDVESAIERDRHGARYLLLEELIGGTPAR